MGCKNFSSSQSSMKFDFQSPPKLALFRVPSSLRKSYHFLPNPSKNWTRFSKLVRFFSSTASCVPNSTTYGGWDDASIIGDSDRSGESDDVFRNFIVSVGMDDKKYLFVFMLGLVCAMAISRVKVSSILVFPSSVLVFAIGFTVGFFRNGGFNNVRVIGSNGSKISEKEENLKLSAAKLKSLVEFLNEVDFTVNNLKSNVQNALRNNKIKVDDLCDYVIATDSIKLPALNARNIVNSLIEENSNSVLVENNKTKRKKEAGEVGYQMLHSIGSLFGENIVSSNLTKVRENVKASDQTRKNGSVSSVEDRTLNLIDDNKSNGKLDSFPDSLTNSAVDVNRNGRIGDTCKRTEEFPNEKDYNYLNNGLRFTNNHGFSLNIRMKQMESESSFVHEQLLDRGDETLRSSHNKRDNGCDSSQYKEDKVNYDDHHHLPDDLSAPESEFNTSSSVKISDDMLFDRYLAEATDLVKQAKEFIKGRHVEEQAEIMLYRSSNLLSKAVDLKPMSLLAVGQLGNTYLLHGELKLKISRELRTLLSGRIQSSSSSGKHSRILKGLRNKITSKEEIAPLLVNVCEECEELLVEAGRKYRLALSIDGNDVRALYNWGLALSFRGQLIADIGPDAAFEAERVFLAAIDKFDAMLSKGNVYAPDALFRWGVALQQRSRLRPASSEEKVKLLQQAKRLYEDALHMDSNNMQVKDALSSCISELNYRQF